MIVMLTNLVEKGKVCLTETNFKCSAFIMSRISVHFKTYLYIYYHRSNVSNTGHLLRMVKKKETIDYLMFNMKRK